jgi:hypothetical protein
MIRSLLSGTALLVSIVGLVGCTMTQGTVCRNSSGHAIENSDYCKLNPTHRANLW